MNIPKLIEEQKHVYGTYSVMAWFNIRTVLDYIQKSAGIKGYLPKDKQEDYWLHPTLLCLITKNIPEKIIYVQNKLMQHFPFLKYIMEEKRTRNNKQFCTKHLDARSEDLYKILSYALQVLKTYRDATSHFVFNDPRLNGKSDFWNEYELDIAKSIDILYTNSLRGIKEKYGYTTEKLTFIQGYRYKEERKDGKRLMRPNLDFFLSMLSYNGDVNRRYHLSAVGVAQLICLFLDKQYINIFLSKLPIYDKYALNSEEGKIIRRSMGIHSIRLPKERILSEKGKMSVAMDMLNELKKCPAELFDTLSYSDQCNFRRMSEDHNEVLLKRHSDRFAQLALQYIDYNKLFTNIRFHVNMGKLRYLFNAGKQCIDGQTRVRVLEHPINAFGRIDEMEEKRTNDNGTFAKSGIRIRDFENMQRDDSNPENYPYIVDTFTHYLIDNNKIEMIFADGCYIPNIIHDKNGKWYVENQIPTCRMSTLELPAMMLHLHLLGAKKTEERIRMVCENYDKLFAALKDGTLDKSNITEFGIDMADMPQKVIEAVEGTGKNDGYAEYVKQTTDELLQDTIRRIERLKNDKRTVNSTMNKMGKRGFRQIIPGKLAEFLAQDIVKFQWSALSGEDYGTDRLTGLNYRVMQATMATYDSEMQPDAFNHLATMFRNAGLTVRDGANGHPFLFSALSRQPANAIELYECYLLARKNYLTKLQQAIKNGECVKVPFANPGKNKWKKRNEYYYSVLGEIYSEDVPVELPRQMFDEDIKNCLKQKQEMSDIDFDNANVTYLISEYIKRVCNDDFQEFYSWKRHYRYIDMLKGETDNKNCLLSYYTTIAERDCLWKNRTEAIEEYRKWAIKKKRQDRMTQKISDADFEEILDRRLSNTRNEYQKTEKMIRRYKVQDALLFLMAKDTMTKNIDFGGKGFKLKEIAPEAEKGILSEVMPMDFFFEKDGKRYTIHSNGMKIKNYGDFYRLVHDRRLGSLLKILSTVTIEKEDLDNEFRNYDTCRPQIAKIVIDFEKMETTRNDNLKERANNGERIDFGIILKELNNSGAFTDKDTRILSQVRNAFEHNGYPRDVSIVNTTTLPEIAESLITAFEEKVKKND